MGIFEKIKNGLSKTRKNITGLFDSFTGANDEFFDELEETLITADLGWTWPSAPWRSFGPT